MGPGERGFARFRIGWSLFRAAVFGRVGPARVGRAFPLSVDHVGDGQEQVGNGAGGLGIKPDLTGPAHDQAIALARHRQIIADRIALDSGGGAMFAAWNGQPSGFGSASVARELI
jgi:hypothetical protein